MERSTSTPEFIALQTGIPSGVDQEEADGVLQAMRQDGNPEIPSRRHIEDAVDQPAQTIGDDSGEPLRDVRYPEKETAAQDGDRGCSGPLRYQVGYTIHDVS